MAALCEEFTLCGLLSGAEGRRLQQDGLLGVEEAGERDKVLLTDGGRTVTVYKVSDQRPLGSWAVRQGQRITCPAVYNHSTGEYVVVHDKKVLRVWKDEDVSFDKAFKATLSADVFRVHSLPDAEPLVLFCGGAPQFLDALLADPQQEIETIITEDEKITWSMALTDGGQPVLVFITEKHSDWFVYTWRPTFSACRRWRLPPTADGSRVLDFSAVMKNKMISLAILYSSGHIGHSEVSLLPCVQEVELLVSPLLQLPEPADAGAVLILHDSYMATLTSCTAQQKDRLCIWNTSFQTLQDHKEFSQKTWTQLWAHDSKLYVPHTSSLLVLRFTCEPSCLASALGKETLKSAPEAVSVLNWEALIGKTEPPKPPAARKTPGAKKPERGSEETRSYLEVLSAMETAAEAQIPPLVQRVWLTADQVHFQIAVCSVTQRLVTRCKNQPQFYPHSSFIRLIESGTLSYSLCPDLMPLCLEKQDVRALQLCLEQFVDIPEDVLCSCLKTFLSVSEEILRKANINTKSVASYIQESAPAEEVMESEPAAVLQNGFSSPIVEDDSCDVQMLDKMIPKSEPQGPPVSSGRAVLLNSVLASRFSETFLLPHLKDLASGQVILLLTYLHYLYKKCSESVALTLPGEERLSVTQVLDWMNLILDANFTVLVLLPKAKPLLRTLQKFVRSQMKFFSELNKLEGSLSELQKLRRPSRSCGRYSIEVLELY